MLEHFRLVPIPMSGLNSLTSQCTSRCQSFLMYFRISNSILEKKAEVQSFDKSFQDCGYYRLAHKVRFPAPRPNEMSAAPWNSYKTSVLFIKQFIKSRSLQHTPKQHKSLRKLNQIIRQIGVIGGIAFASIFQTVGYREAKSLLFI